MFPRTASSGHTGHAKPAAGPGAILYQRGGSTLRNAVAPSPPPGQRLTLWRRENAWGQVVRQRETDSIRSLSLRAADVVANGVLIAVITAAAAWYICKPPGL
jgi:hypothetical protein